MGVSPISSKIKNWQQAPGALVPASPARRGIYAVNMISTEKAMFHL